MTVFPNAKPRIFGSDDHTANLTGNSENSIGVIDTPAVAGLSGSVLQSKDVDQGFIQLNATNSGSSVTGRNRTGNNGNVLITFSNVITPPNASVLIIIIAATPTISTSFTGKKNWVLKRNADIIDSFLLESSDSNSSNVDMKVFVDISPVAGINTYTLIEDDNVTFGGVIANLFFIKVTDTHVGSIITPATATKQIITADSHIAQLDGINTQETRGGSVLE